MSWITIVHWSMPICLLLVNHVEINGRILSFILIEIAALCNIFSDRNYHLIISSHHRTFSWEKIKYQKKRKVMITITSSSSTYSLSLQDFLFLRFDTNVFFFRDSTCAHFFLLLLLNMLADRHGELWNRSAPTAHYAIILFRIYSPVTLFWI